MCQEKMHPGIFGDQVVAARGEGLRCEVHLSSKKRVRADAGGSDAGGSEEAGPGGREIGGLHNFAGMDGDGGKISQPSLLQEACSVAGILLQQTKKRRIMRKRVQFSKESLVRLVDRDLLLAQYNLCELGAMSNDSSEERAQAAQETYEGSACSSGVGYEDDGLEDDTISSSPYTQQDPSISNRQGADDAPLADKCFGEVAILDSSMKVVCCDEVKTAASQMKMSHVIEGDVHNSRDENGMRYPGTGHYSDDNENESECAVETKTNDGPSLINVVTQTLIIGLVERDVRNVSDVLHAVRRCIAPACFEKWVAEQESSDLLESAFWSTSSSDEEESPRKHCSSKHRRHPRPPVVPGMIVDGKIFDETRDHLAKLLDRINNHGRASLLPSTAQIGSPFVPALEFLLQSTQDAERRNENDRQRLAAEAEDSNASVL